VSALGGLLCDAVSPVPFGTHAALFATAHVVVYNARERLQRDETAVRVAVALVLNLVLYLAIGFVRIRAMPSGAIVWPRLLSDLLLSQGAVLLCAPWFFALQERSLELARAIRARPA
jgi:rod shape-determining protein MreD